MQLLLGWVVVVAEKIVRLNDLDVVDLCCLQDFARAFGSGDIPVRTNLAPPAKRAADPNLRPNSDDQRDADVQEPVRTQTKSVRAADIQHAAGAQNKAQ